MPRRLPTFLIILCTICVSTDPIAAAEISGRVLGGTQPLAGVCVSDGCRVVRTDHAGKYALTVDEQSGHFIFVTIPSGFWTDDYYVPVAAASKQPHVNFELQPVAQSDRFDFVFLTDMHLGEKDISVAKFNASLAEINQLDPRPAFLLLQGDICLQTKGAGDLYRDCLKNVPMPVRHGAGNHEMLLGESDPRGEFERCFGPTYYSFNWGALHCIVLDGNKPIAGQTGWQAVHGAVEGRELAWLKADLAELPAKQLIVIGVHIPIVSTYPNRRQTSPKNAPYWEMTNREKLTELLASHNVRLVLQGHMHENERATIGGVEYVESISICGSWWKHSQNFERGVDNSPRGYRIISVVGNGLTHHYQSTAESKDNRGGTFVALQTPIRPSRTTDFVFNCYDAPNDSHAVARVDAGPWRPMSPYTVDSPATPGLTMPHHFRWVPDTTQLNPGKHTISTRVSFPDGEVVEVTQPFTIGR